MSDFNKRRKLVVPLSDQLTVCEYGIKCFKYNFNAEKFSFASHHMSNFLHLLYRDYSEFKSIIIRNEINPSDKSFLEVYFVKELDSLQPKNSIVIHESSSNHPFIVSLKERFISVGQSVLEMYYNENNCLCLNMFNKDEKLCDCSKIHILNRGILGAIKHYRSA